LIVPPDGGKPIAYTRASSFGDVLDDRSNIEKWKIRHVIKGLVNNAKLFMQASATPIENKSDLNKIAEQAMEEAGASRASDTGTLLHSLTEQVDSQGRFLGPIPPEHANDINAYIRGVKDRFAFNHIERFMVCDELQAAGTPDRLGFRMEVEYLDVVQRVCDLKTSASANYLDKHAVQLAIYAHSDFYDPATGERESVDVAKDYGYIFHLPAFQGTFQLFKLDLEAGWEGALLAADVRKWRKRKGICTPI
jgi:hypothetical protein